MSFFCRGSLGKRLFGKHTHECLYKVGVFVRTEKKKADRYERGRLEQQD